MSERRADAGEVQRGHVVRRAIAWLRAVEQHRPGEQDVAAVVIGSWPSGLDVIRYVTRLARTETPDSRGLLLSNAEISQLQLFMHDKNKQLKRGALLHSDIAILGLSKGWSDSVHSMKVRSTDGRGVLESGLVHWEISRALLDLISPQASRDDSVRQWYIATSAYMLARRKWGDADTHLKRALQLFPGDAKLQFYAGIVHENYASPESQGIRMQWIRASVASKALELKKAWDYFEKSIQIESNFAEARLHLGRVMGLLGEHGAAAVQLRRAAAEITDRQLQYYCSLYLGSELGELNQREEARREFECAAALYPAAQSPLLGLSQLARSRGDFSGAAAAVQRVFQLAAGGGVPEDPWWFYDVSHVRDLYSLLSEMYRTFETHP